MAPGPRVMVALVMSVWMPMVRLACGVTEREVLRKPSMCAMGWSAWRESAWVSRLAAARMVSTRDDVVCAGVVCHRSVLGGAI